MGKNRSRARFRRSARKPARPLRTAALLLAATGLVLLAASAPAQVPGDLALVQVVSGLTAPLGIRHAGDGSGRLFIVGKRGQIRIWTGAQLLGTPFFDITLGNDPPPFIWTGSEQGLLGLAFDPDFSTNGFFYVNYTELASPGDDADCPVNADCDWNTVIARYTVSDGNPNVADPNSAVRLLVINQDYSNHNGGNLLFGPDGHLYIGMGDGGFGGDLHCRSQNMDTLLGKMLRIDVDGGGFPADCGLVQNYTVPADNPFRDGGGGDCDAIWALGVRNPWRWSFDRFTGDMIIGDVGQNTREEISFEPWTSAGGLNYGWKVMEGNTCFDPDPIDNDCPMSTPSCFSPSYTDPVIDYGRTLGNAVTGGYVYRGPAIGGLQGRYVYADYGSGRIWIATPAGGASWSTMLWQDTALNISTFGEDEAGELYLASLSGTIYRFESPSSVFGDQFESGDLRAWSVAQP